MQVHRFTIDDSAAIDALKNRLTAAFSRVAETVERSSIVVQDSFDWRLHGHGWQLNRTGKRFAIIHRADGRVISDILVQDSKKRRFWWDFPASDFSNHLKQRLAVRALMPMATIQQRLTRFNACNTDDKIVARLVLEHITQKGRPHQVIQCRVVPVRGYPKAFQSVIALVNTLGLEPTEVAPVVALLEKTGASPGAYSSKIDIALGPDMPAQLAVRHILAALVATISVNLPGIEQDIDTEFLHDLRVAARRARCLLGQLKGVLDPVPTAQLQGHLKLIGSITGPVRDLDVVLLKKAEYVDLAPECLKPGTRLLFRMLQRKRDQARRRMLNHMAGPDFSAAVSALHAWVQNDPPGASATGDVAQPIGEVAKSVIYNRYRRIIRQGGRISNHCADDALHALRINCKKLRYLLEFFRSLFPDDQITLLTRQLKQLQDNLGDFNDLSVQQAIFTRHLQSMAVQTKQALVPAAAAGGLITRLCMARQTVRSSFMRVFQTFNEPKNRRRFKKLLA